MATRSQILVRGIVQGVGFRPFVYTQASRRALRGRVLNNTTGVFIELEGNRGDIEEFLTDLKSNPPPLSTIETIECSHDLAPIDYHDFLILDSAQDGERFVPIPVDISTCDDCLKELFDPHDRRYRYPFINCTNCGPRFTIIQDIPYDRARTTMEKFEMCAACRAEYENSHDRRFHAEPVACPACGPQLRLISTSALGVEIGSGEPDALVSSTREFLLAGKIVAVKGIGGFHLACDALSATAVERLRSRKYREDKPFAMMASSLDVIREHCDVSDAEAELLKSERRPIVLLHRKPTSTIPAAVAPGVIQFGFMLPYSPLHYLLLENVDQPLVMTSGNVSDEPISYDDAEAIERLSGIADYFLLHDRPIHMRTDDSVARVFRGREMLLRRSRGYVPAPITTAVTFGHEILACGAELKNTFCLTRDNYAFVSHHIGDLENLETFNSFTHGIEHFKRLFYLHPEVVAYDLHPEYLSTKYACGLDDVSVKVGIQHHHAHIASCMADNRIEGEVIGVAMDGLGFGADGRMWGGEFFVADFLEAERLAHLAYIPMPGGAKAIREPWRMAAVYLHRVFGPDFLKLDLDFTRDLDRSAWTTLLSMTESGTNSPVTSSMGRLFDAISALLGVRKTINYEGQAAIELEALAEQNATRWYKFDMRPDSGEIGAETLFRQAVEDLLDNVSPEEVSARFHLGVAHLISMVARHIRRDRKLNRVVLSGGVFQNMFLLERTCRLLAADRFEVFTHQRVPPNDGGISLGQVVIANAQLASGRI
ncbi:MAG TPA: carbamoyltransferase HypF [Pyrinomonadaceae bacterium]|nr:carbamoyltransferase HypF [Pyrinomonadaceae bacterium]